MNQDFQNFMSHRSCPKHNSGSWPIGKLVQTPNLQLAATTHYACPFRLLHTLDIKTATPSGLSFKVLSSRMPGPLLPATWSLKHHGLTLTWTTTNVLRTQVELTATLLPEKGSKSALLTAIYKQHGLHTNGSPSTCSTVLEGIAILVLSIFSFLTCFFFVSGPPSSGMCVSDMQGYFLPVLTCVASRSQL
jgi:hypothetical protein